MTNERRSRSAAEPRILAAIVNFNGAALTERMVSSFHSQEGAGQARLVVVDDASQAEDVADLVARVGERAELLLLATNRGYAAACNAATRIAMNMGAEYTLLMNNDLVLEPSALSKLIGALELRPDWAGVAAATVDASEGKTVLGAGVDIDVRRGRVRHRYAARPVGDLPSMPYAVGALEGACLLLRTDVLRAVGPFDEGFFMYWEDAEWSVRANRLGHQFAIVPGARARHAVSQSSDPRDRIALMIRNRIRFVRATGSRVDQVVFLAYFLLIWLPSYHVARLVPRYGLRAATRLVRDALAWNLADGRRRGRWRLDRPPDWENTSDSDRTLVAKPRE